jgi:hypothetical protein
VKAAATSTAAWRATSNISSKLAETLRTKGPPLDPAALGALNDRAEAASQKALISGDGASIDQAKHFCDLETSIGLEPGPVCKRMTTVLAGLRR